jgi:uncharacterized membrane protein (UPF0127 family)
MDLKRHHVLYALLAVCLIAGILVLITHMQPRASFTSPPAAAVVTGLATSTHADFQFEVVTEEADQERGLGGRSNIPENYGMLFVFPQKDKVGFWMKDILLPIDIVWLSDTGTVLGIEDSISPDTYPDSVYPPEPVKYVLETKAGEMRRKGLSVGSHIELPLPYSQ